MRRMPPADVEDNVNRLIDLKPELEEELYQRVDLPLQVRQDEKTGNSFIESDYNRDGDSYRSPWCNEYYPPIDGQPGFKPTDKLRELEVQANTLFNVYRHLYFEGGVSSVYMWEMDRDFAACFLIKKDVLPTDKKSKGMQGSWNSIHVFSVTGGYNEKDPFTYSLTSTVIVSMVVTKEGMGDLDLSGSVSSVKTKKAVGGDHLVHMGGMIEDMESNLRGSVEGIYMQKTKEIVNGMRVNDPFLKNKYRAFASMGAKAAESMRMKKTAE